MCWCLLGWLGTSHATLLEAALLGGGQVQGAQAGLQDLLHMDQLIDWYAQRAREQQGADASSSSSGDAGLRGLAEELTPEQRQSLQLLLGQLDARQQWRQRMHPVKQSDGSLSWVCEAHGHGGNGNSQVRKD